MTRILMASTLALIFLALTHPAWAWRNTSDSELHTTASSNLLDVPYNEQENYYFCGPAVVQMALGYISGEFIAQQTLAAEMNVTASEGTKTERLSTPFTGRGYGVVSQSGMNLDRLKEENLREHVVIMTILFDDTIGIKTEFDPLTGITFTYFNLHYVVLTGYNSSGIFVNDPWPAAWYQPHGRETGKNAYISNEMLLGKIWWYPFLIVPYPASLTYNVEIEVILEARLSMADNLPYASRIVVDGVEEGTLKQGETAHFKFTTGTAHTISVDRYVSGTQRTRYFCPEYSFTVSSAMTYTFEYRTQYHVELVSPYGTPNGSSWYDAGSTALLSVQPTEVRMTGLLGTMGGKALLDHWTENSELAQRVICDDSSPGYCRVLVVSPMTVTAVWREDYSIPCLMIGSLIVIVLLACLVLLRISRKTL